MPDYSRFFSLFRHSQWSVGSQHFLQASGISHVVKLVKVYIVGSQAFQTQLKVFFYRLTVPAAGLGGDNNLFPPSGNSFTDTLLAVGVPVSGIEKGYTQVKAFPDHSHRIVFGISLDGNASETHN